MLVIPVRKRCHLRGRRVFIFLRVSRWLHWLQVRERRERVPVVTVHERFYVLGFDVHPNVAGQVHLHVPWRI